MFKPIALKSLVYAERDLEGALDYNTARQFGNVSAPKDCEVVPLYSFVGIFSSFIRGVSCKPLKLLIKNEKHWLGFRVRK